MLNYSTDLARAGNESDQSAIEVHGRNSKAAARGDDMLDGEIKGHHLPIMTPDCTESGIIPTQGGRPNRRYGAVDDAIGIDLPKKYSHAKIGGLECQTKGTMGKNGMCLVNLSRAINATNRFHASHWSTGCAIPLGKHEGKA